MITFLIFFCSIVFVVLGYGLLIKRVLINDNLVNVTLHGGQELQVPCAPNTLVMEGVPITIGIRPKALTTNGEGDSKISGKVYAVERLGSETYLYINMPDGQEITVHASGDQALSTNDVISISFQANECQLFLASGESLSAPISSD